MKITKVPKRLAEALPEVQQLLQKVIDAPDDELADILDNISEWCWPRGDLHFWVPVLNRFDLIFEETCRDYDIQNIQINDFTPLRKRLIVSILRFSRLLIENSTSRKIYNSFEHLNTLLFSRDVDVLEATLRLLLRFAQQQTSQHPRQDLVASQSRLATLAVTWSPRDHGVQPVDVAKDSTIMPPGGLHVRFQFFKRVSSSIQGGTSLSDNLSEDSTLQTPTRPRNRDRTTSSGNVGFSLPNTPTTSSLANETEGLTTIDLGQPAHSGKTDIDVLVDAIEANDIPPEDHFELFQRIRLAMAMPSPQKRRQLLACRLLAIACYAHITPEATASTQLFLYEPDIVQKTGELVHPEHGLSQDIVRSALYALDALGRYRSKFNEVLSSVSASVNHGVLMQVFRKIIDDLATGMPKKTDQIIDAFYGLISFITSTSSGSTVVVGAGLVQLLVELIDKARPDTYIVQRSIARSLGLLDSVIYAYLPAFDLFCQARGLDVFVRRIEEQVDYDIQSTHFEEGQTDGNRDAPYGRLTFGRAHLLRGFLQSISHMMVSTGTADGLRNLIDTSLLTSLKRMLENRRVFGPQNLSLAINIMATFVHNEATTLGIIQEKKLPEAFLAFINEDIEAHFDVISAVPNAIGALCLNQAGLDMFGNEAVVSKMLSLLTSERHVKVLADQDNVTIFGGAIDELIRHQPTMKQAVIDGIMSLLRQIHDEGAKFVPPLTEDVAIYQLSKVSEEEATWFQSKALEEGIGLGDVLTDDADVKKYDTTKQINQVASNMDITSRFLEIFFQSTSHCKDFLKADGLDLLLKFYDLPCLSYNFASSTTSDSMVHLLRYISEISPSTIIHALLRQVKVSLDETSELWNVEEGSKLAKLLYPTTDEEWKKCNDSFRKLIKLNARIQLLSDVTPSFTFTATKTPAAFLQVLNSTPTPGSAGDIVTLDDLSAFQRSWVWQSILFKAVAPSSTSNTKSQAKESDAEKTDTDMTEALGQSANAEVSERTTNAEASTSLPDSTPREPLMRNAIAIRYIVSQTKLSLGTFFAETNKLLYSRRSSDNNHKRLSVLTAGKLGKSLRDFLVWKSHPNPALSCAYVTCALAQVKKILYDDRVRTYVLAQTMVLIPFLHEGGLDEMIVDYAKLSDEFGHQFDAEGKPNESSNLDDAVRLGHACSGLRTCLEIFLKFVTAKPLLDAPSTHLITSKETGIKESYYEGFEPHALLIRLRHKVLPIIIETWSRQWLTKMPVAVSRVVLQVLLKILEADNENIPKKETDTPAIRTSTTTASNGGSTSLSNALAGLSGALGGLRNRTVPQPPDETRISQLTEMGFPRRAARHALVRCSNNVTAATEYLLMHPELVTLMSDDSTVSREEAGDQPTNDSGTRTAQNESHSGAEAVNEASATQANVAGSSEGADAHNSSLDTEPERAPEPDVRMDDSDQKEKQVSEQNEERDRDIAQKLQELKEMRKQATSDLVPRALKLADHSDAFIFDVRTAIRIASSSFLDSSWLINILNELQVLAPTSLTDAQRIVSVRLHLLALLFNDPNAAMELSENRAKHLMQALMSLVEVQAANLNSKPSWFASFFLILSAAVRADFEVPKIPMQGKEESSPNESSRVHRSSLYEDSYPQLLDLCIQRLKNVDILVRDDLLAFYYFMVLFTHHSKLAQQFLERDGISLFLHPFVSLDVKTIEGCRPYALIVIRQIVEMNHAVLSPIVSFAISNWFRQQRGPRTVDFTSMSRGLSHVMLRDPDTFVDAATKELVMVDYSVSKANCFFMAKESDKDDAKKAGKSAPSLSFTSPLDHDPEESMELTPSSPTKAGHSDGQEASKGAVPVDVAEPIMSFLVTEILRNIGEVFSKKNETQSSTDDPAKSSPQDKMFFYVAFLLQTMSELLSSYDCCKYAFLNLAKKRFNNASTSVLSTALRKDQTPSKGKINSNILTVFLTELIPMGFVSAREQEDMRRSMTISNWAMSTIVALCAEVPARNKEASPDQLITSRKIVLDTVAKSIKESTTIGSVGTARQNESIEARYGRLYALSDLSYRLLKAQPNPSASHTQSSRPWGNPSLQLAKTMLERNFVSVLTSAIADVDLNLPMVKPLLDRILKPLEYLTKLSIRMNKAEREGASRSKPADDDELQETSSEHTLTDSDMDEDDDEEDEEDNEEPREETPDFYRNSSLGMHTGDLEGGHVNYDEVDDEDDEDEDMDEIPPHVGYDDEGTEEDSDEDDDDIEEHIVEVMDEDDDDSEGDEDEIDDDIEDEDEDDPWMDEEDDDDEGEPLDFVMEGEGNDAHHFLEEVGDIVGDVDPDDVDYENEEGLPGHILVDEEGDEDEDDQDEDDAESVLEEVFDERLQPLNLLQASSGRGRNGSVDRFGANWNFTNNSRGPQQPTQGQGHQTVTPFAFIHQPAQRSRSSRSRRLLDWDSDPLATAHGGSRLTDSFMSNHDVASHPLLMQESGNEDQHGSRFPRHIPRNQQDANGAPDWARSLEELMQGGAMQFLETLLSRSGVGGRGGPDEPIRISLTSQDGMPRMTIAGPGGVPIDASRTSATRHEAGSEENNAHSNPPLDVVTLVREFSPEPTSTRWKEGMRIVSGTLQYSRTDALCAYVVNALRPPYLAKQKELEKKKAELRDEKQKNTEELNNAKREKERVEKELGEARAQYDDLIRSQQTQHQEQDAAREASSSSQQEDTEMTEQSQSVPAAPEDPSINLELGSIQEGLSELNRSTPHDATPQPQRAGDQQEAVESSRERITTIINGSEIDITDSGIDPTFLEALPEDMREEVLNQHFREQRAAAAASSNSAPIEASNIAPEFLDALPPDIRSEVIQQEAIVHQRRRNDDQIQGSENSGNSEMDPASFLATLNPELRSAVLMEQDDSFLNALPSNMHAEVDNARRSSAHVANMTRVHRRFEDATSQGDNERAGGSGGNTTEHHEQKKATPRDAIQLLDKSGIATLVRLMFFPQLDLQQSGLRNVLVNLAENSKTRTELLNLLLMLLAEGCSSESNAVDRSFTNMSGRVHKPVQTPTRPQVKRNSTTPSLSTPSGSHGASGSASNSTSAIVAPLSRAGDEAPFLIAARSIDMLLHLTGANEHAALYFLKDDPCNNSLMKWFVKNNNPLVKGKVRSTVAESGNAPINILLVLLGRPSILGNAQLVDNLVALLNTVTRQLPTIHAQIEKKKQNEEHHSNQNKEEQTETDDKPSGAQASNAQETVAIPSVAESDEKASSLPTSMPVISGERLAAIVKPLSTSISSKGFQHTLAVASHLAWIDGARDEITAALHHEASLASQNLLGELDDVLESLPEPPQQEHEESEAKRDGRSGDATPADNNITSNAPQQSTTRINSPALTQLASPSSSQTVILRSLRAIEWVLTRPAKTPTVGASNGGPSNTSTRLGTQFHTIPRYHLSSILQ